MIIISGGVKNYYNFTCSKLINKINIVGNWKKNSFL